MINQAAWLPCQGARFEVKEAPLTMPGPGEVLIQNHVLAMNPADHKCQDSGLLISQYPSTKPRLNILGFEVAGEVKDVGEGVTRFKKGDRLVGLAFAFRTQNFAHAGFQLFTTCPVFAVAHIPREIAYTKAAVLPIGLCTAAVGLYERTYLGLAPPPAQIFEARNRSILIWGGSSVVGSAAIQLATATGLNIVATASARNHSFVKSLGAVCVLDYADTDVVEKIVMAVSGTMLVGAYDSIAEPKTVEQSAQVVHACGGGRLVTAQGGGQPEQTLFGNVLRKAGGAYMAERLARLPGGRVEGREMKAKPNPIVVEGGLEKCQEAVDLLKKGVSAAKVVLAL